MKRIIRNLFTHPTTDSRIRARVFGDEILHAVDPGKCLVSGLSWRGDLQPILDSYMEQLKPLENGLMLGRVLHAEEIGHVLDTGRLWLGNLQTKLLAAAADFASAGRPEEAGAEPGTDLAEVLGNLEHLRRQMGTADRAKIADGMRRLRDAARRVSSDRRPTGDSRGLMRTRIGDFSRPVSIAEINRRNHDFHAAREVAHRTGDRITAFRDAQHAATHAASERGRVEAMNRGSKAFWSRGEPPTVTRDMRAAFSSGAGTIAGINSRNRAFWATRS